MLNLNALWSVNFHLNPSGTAKFGSGVVVLNNGKIHGGDETYYYTGSYVVSENIFTAKVKLTHYSGPYNNLIGEVKEAEVNLSGVADGHEFEISGKYLDSEQTVTAKLERLVLL